MRVHAAVDSIVGNVHAFDEPAQPYRNEEQDLWLAVIMNAIRDARGGYSDGPIPPPSPHSHTVRNADAA